MILSSSIFCNFIASAQTTIVPDSLTAPALIKDNDTLTICFAGDMMMHSRQMEYGYRTYFRYISDRFTDADIAVANMEFTLAGEPYTGYPQFSAPDGYADYIADSGFDIFLCANNHILDKGSDGAERTLEQYRNIRKTHGIMFTGAAGSQEELEATTPLVIRCREASIAFVNFTYGTNLGSDSHWPRINYMGQRDFLEEAIHKAETLADFTIVLPHWGEEYQLLHSDGQENTAKWLIDNGADLIVGTHPHVVQDIGNIKGVPVIYSLGNAVSNMSAPNTQLGLVLMATLVVKTNGKVILDRIEEVHTWCSRPGGYNESYIVIPVDEYIGRREEWHGKWDYDKMVTTYERVRHIHKHEQ